MSEIPGNRVELDKQIAPLARGADKILLQSELRAWLNTWRKLLAD